MKIHTSFFAAIALTSVLAGSAAKAEDLSGVWKTKDTLYQGKTSEACMPWYHMIKEMDDDKDKKTGGVSYNILKELKGGKRFSIKSGDTLEKAREDKKSMVLELKSGRNYVVTMKDVMPMDESCSMAVSLVSKGEFSADWKSAKGEGVATFKIAKGKCAALPPQFLKPLKAGCSVYVKDSASR